MKNAACSGPPLAHAVDTAAPQPSTCPQREVAESPLSPKNLNQSTGQLEYSTFRAAALGDLGPDVFMGFFDAYFRTFAIPQIADVLLARQYSVTHAAKRASDTGIIIYELLTNGFDSEEGRSLIELLRRMHHSVPGSRDDFMYVLVCLLVCPDRWLRRMGPRPFTEEETQHGLSFFSHLGGLLGVSFPATIAACYDFVRSYEDGHVARSAAALALVKAAEPLVRDKLPPVIRRRHLQVLAAILGDQRVAHALGLPRPRLVDRLLLRISMAARSQRSNPYFVSGRSSRTYPQGYRLKDLGPEGSTESQIGGGK